MAEKFFGGAKSTAVGKKAIKQGFEDYREEEVEKELEKQKKIEEAMEQERIIAEEKRLADLKEWGEKKIQYNKALNSYHQLTKQIIQLEKHNQFRKDPKVQDKIFVLDKERHTAHLELIKMAAGFGNSEEDVLVDIVRESRSLESYGLPEFSILVADDLIDFVHDERASAEFNVDPFDRKPRKMKDLNPEHLASPRLIKPSEFVLVYAISPVRGYGMDVVTPKDYYIREQRMRALKDAIGGKIMDIQDTYFHDAYVHILGLVLANKDFEKILDTIRNNPSIYRLDEKYYSEVEKNSLSEHLNDHPPRTLRN